MASSGGKCVLRALLLSGLSVAAVALLYEAGVLVPWAATEISSIPATTADERRATRHEASHFESDRGRSGGNGNREAALRDQLKMRRQEVEGLELEIDRLDRELQRGYGPQIGSLAWIEACADAEGPDTTAIEGCSYISPGQDVLDELARCGVVKTDAPPFIIEGPDAIDSMIEGLDLRGNEADAFARVAQQYQAEFEGRFVDLAIELGFDRELLGQMPWYAVQGLVDQKLGDESWEPIQQQIAQERAGHAEVKSPDSRSQLERSIRNITGAGDDFEEALARELGSQRAAELRSTRDGWFSPSWNKGMVFGECPRQGTEPEPHPRG